MDSSDLPPIPACLARFRTIRARPKHVHIESAWRGHVPFGIFIIEALKPRLVVELGVDFGTSLMAFCQGVEETGIECQIYGIDLWNTGERHKRAYPHVTQYVTNSGYDRFCTLVREDFIPYAGNFEDGSIELLHIDGCHAYRFVRRDFDTYLPKLNPKKSLVLLHDSAVRNRGEEFEVWRLVDELRERYRVVEFQHWFGLAVVATGWDELPDEARLLYGPHSDEILRFFEHRGNTVAGQITFR